MSSNKKSRSYQSYFTKEHEYETCKDLELFTIDQIMNLPTDSIGFYIWNTSSVLDFDHKRALDILLYKKKLEKITGVNIISNIGKRPDDIKFPSSINYNYVNLTYYINNRFDDIYTYPYFLNKTKTTTSKDMKTIKEMTINDINFLEKENNLSKIFDMDIKKEKSLEGKKKDKNYIERNTNSREIVESDDFFRESDGKFGGKFGGKNSRKFGGKFGGKNSRKFGGKNSRKNSRKNRRKNSRKFGSNRKTNK